MKKIMTIALAGLLLAGCAPGGSDTTAETTSAATETTAAAVVDESLYLAQFLPPEEGEEIGVITTSMGVIKVKFFPGEAPLAVANFKELAEAKYYDGITFHRVINDFMIQGGDPTGTGMGGSTASGEDFADEFSPYLHNYRGALSMANTGQTDTNSSQFFIVQSSDPGESYLQSVEDAIEGNPAAAVDNVNRGTMDLLSDIFPQVVLEKYRETGGYVSLDYRHTVFGQVFEGMDVVDAIAAVGTDEDDKPLEDVMIEKVEIMEYAE